MKSTKNFWQKKNKALIFLNLFFLQSYLIRFQIGPYPSNLQEILIFLQIITFIGLILSEKRFLKTIKNTVNHWFSMALIALTGVSLILAPIINNIYAIRHGKFLFFAIVFSFIFTESLNKKNEQRKALAVGALGAVAFGLFSLLYNLFGNNLAHDLRLQGPLDSATAMAFYLSPFLIFSIIQLLKNKKITHLVSSIFLIAFLIATQSMGAILAVLGVLIIYAFTKHKSKFLKNRLAIITLSLLTISAITSAVYLKILPTINTNYSSLDERGQIWTTTVDLLKEPKSLAFGLGFGQFEEHYRKSVKEIFGPLTLDSNNPHPHNIFLLFTAQYGILGLILIIYLAFLIVKDLKNPQIATFLLIYFFIHGLIDSPFFKNDITILFLIFIEMLYLRPSQSSRKTDSGS